MKQCNKCGVDLVVDYNWTGAMAQNYQNTCTPCHKAYLAEWKYLNNDKLRDVKYQQQYGISLDTYNDMLEEQGGKCAICNGEEITRHKGGNIRRLSIDHCHKTGKVRGLLCANCNTGIGKLKDDVTLVKLALNYLENWL